MPANAVPTSREDDLYWRTRSQYLQEVNFSVALGALCELAGQDQHLGLGVVATGGIR